MKSGKNQPTVTLRRERGMVLVERPAAEVVRTALSVQGRAYDATSAGWISRNDALWYSRATRYGAAITRTLTLTDDGETAFPAGLLPRAWAALVMAGFRVVLADDPYWRAPRPALDRTVLGRLPDSLYEAVDGVRTGGPRLTYLPRRMRLARAVQRLLAASPTARVVIPVPNRAAARDWVYRLDGEVGRPVYEADEQDRHWGPCPRVTVVCESLFRTCTEENFDLAVVPDALRLLRSTTRMESIEERQIPAVGFLPAGAQLDRYERLRAWALFGGIIKPVETNTRVAITSVGVTVPSPSRSGDWRARVRDHRARSTLVAAIANAYRQNDAVVIRSLSLPLSWSQVTRVAVLVETVQRSQQLGAEQPGWQLLAGQTDADLNGPIACVITDGWRAAHRSFPLNVLIDARAADPVHPLPFSGGGILVDIRDDWHPMLRARHEQRMATYARAGHWIV